MTLRIEMFGNMIQELKYWHTAIDDASNDESSEYCESRYSEVLDSCRELRLLLIEELDNYVRTCKETSIPIDLNYFRIAKELKETYF